MVVVWCIQNDKPNISNKGNKGWLSMKNDPTEKDNK
jgi:hypothetical protein